MEDPFEAYGFLARSRLSPTVQAGRRNLSVENEKLITNDVVAKLGLLPQHSLLEIGCGPGALLCPLASLINRATGLDHPDMLTLARGRCQGKDNVSFISGRFPQIKPEGTFDHILVYSVLHYLPDFAAVEQFIDEALHYVHPGGMLLLGDLPNTDKLARFKSSEFGKEFEKQWKSSTRDELQNGDPLEIFSDSAAVGSFNDDGILSLLSRYRKRGYNVYVLPQPEGLPYCYSREDMLIHLP